MFASISTAMSDYFAGMNPAATIFPVLLIAWLLLFFDRYRISQQPRAGTLEWIALYDRPKFTLSGRRFPMEKKDVLPLCVIVAVYGIVAFTLLGSTTDPQTFYQFTEDQPTLVIDLGQEMTFSKLWYYTGLYTGEYTLKLSTDGQTWVEQLDEDGEDTTAAMTQTHADLFKWRVAALNNGDEPTTARYISITASDQPMELGELALIGEDGKPLSLNVPGELFDEQDTVPDAPSWYNSMYFDEIYHGRTALENLRNIDPYEITHPPLGKIIIMCSIKVFGMTPFGWRFPGTLLGVVMLIPFYILLKNMFGKTPVAACGTIVFAFDFMHYVQTRIATIDTYGVLFILLSYLFLFRWMTADYNAPFKASARDLFLSGLFFGIGCACKWIVVYAGMGLCLLYIITMVCRGRGRTVPGFGKHLAATLAFSVLCFIIIPLTIYCLSYIPYGRAQGMTFPAMLASKDYYKIIWDNQVYMLTYHLGVNEPHPYSSRWYQWIFDVRPILYYLEYMGKNKSAFGCFNSPTVAWGGLLALLSLFAAMKKRRDPTALFIVIGYFSQFVPWLFISRTTFAYHYFPSSMFLVVALAYVFNRLLERDRKNIRMLYSFTGVSVGLFAAFYPVLSGITVPIWYTYNFLKWFPTWPFG